MHPRSTSEELLNIPNLGIFIPVMGTKSTSGVADALFSPVQQRLLALLFAQPQRRFQSAEVIRLAGSGTGAVHRQLQRLTDAGLLSVTRVGNQKHYQANRDSPVFEELHGLVIKTVGLVEPIRKALAPLAVRIRAAFVYGSVAKGTERAASDVDLIVLSASLHHADLYEALQKAERALGRVINPTLLTLDEWRAKRARRGSFAARVAVAPRLFVIGCADDIA